MRERESRPATPSRAAGPVTPSRFGAAAEPDGQLGVPAERLTDDDLVREMESLSRTRVSTLRHGSDSAVAEHDRRTAELENEYLRRRPEREIDPERLRSGARRR
ncbi:MAG: DUF6158 family protein [Micromonosporaceae bacterium]